MHYSTWYYYLLLLFIIITIIYYYLFVICYLLSIGTLDHRFVGEVNIVSYILKMLNEQKLYHYVKKYNLEGPCQDTGELLHNVGERIGALLKGGFIDEGRSATHFIKNFREGQFGRIMLDSINEVDNNDYKLY